MSQISIYIVEDELLISASLKSQLQHFGYLISGSSIRGETALEEIKNLSMQGKEPEIVLMDIHLRGEIDGIETARLLIEQFHCAIIFLTGQSSKEVYERSFRIKPFGYLLKPIDMEQTKMTIEIAAYQRNLEMENTRYQKKLEVLLEKQSKENREMIDMYQMIIENSLMGMTIMQDNHYVFTNQSTADIFGVTQEEFLTFTFQDILLRIHPDDRETVISRARSRQDGDYSPTHTKIRIFLPDGRIKQVESFVSVVTFKGKPALNQTFLDISAFVNYTT